MNDDVSALAPKIVWAVGSFCYAAFVAMLLVITVIEKSKKKENTHAWKRKFSCPSIAHCEDCGESEIGVYVHEMIEDESNVTRERIMFITEGEKNPA